MPTREGDATEWRGPACCRWCLALYAWSCLD